MAICQGSRDKKGRSFHIFHIYIQPLCVKFTAEVQSLNWCILEKQLPSPSLLLFSSKVYAAHLLYVSHMKMGYNLYLFICRASCAASFVFGKVLVDGVRF